MAGWFKTLLSPITDVVKKPIEQWGERKKIKVEAESEVIKLNAQTKVAKAATQLRMAEKGQIIDSDYDKRAQEGMKHTLMDEILTFILIFPIILLFLSAVFPTVINQVAVIAAVSALSKFPIWYMALICGVYASYLGLRWVVKPLLGAILGFFGKSKTLKITDSGKDM